jgi:branched-chain amino acid transport system substrate-binding protein
LGSAERIGDAVTPKGEPVRFPSVKAAAAAVAVMVIVAGACGSSSKSSSSSSAGSSPAGNTASAPGISSGTVTVGFVSSVVGVAGPNFVNYPKGAQARIDQQNAQGGINGRKLQMVLADDAGSVNQNLTAAQSLASKNVFGIIAGTPFMFASYRYLQQQGIPVVGGGYDGPEWNQLPNTNMFSVLGPNVPDFQKQAENTAFPTFLKSLGATNVASLGYGVSPSSSASAKGTAEAAKASGLKAGYLNTSIPFGSVNVTSVVLGMKQAGVDSVWLAMDNNTNFAILSTSKQNGLDLKVPVAATGYGQSVLDDPTAAQTAQGAYFISEGPPLDSKAEKDFRAALQKYAGFSGVPGFDWYQGWTNMDLMIKGLEVAGKNPTRQSFITNLRNVTSYDAGGLLPNSIDLSLAAFGKAPPKSCQWYAKLQGTTFVPIPSDGSTVCGTPLTALPGG